MDSQVRDGSPLSQREIQDQASPFTGGSQTDPTTPALEVEDLLARISAPATIVEEGGKLKNASRLSKLLLKPKP